MQGALQPLKVPGFARLAAAYLVNEVGDWFGQIALAILVFAHTGSALATAGLFVAGKFVPAIAAPPLTARLDRVPTKRALTAVYVAEALAFAVLAGVTGIFTLWLVLPLALVDGALAVTGRALARAASGTVLERADALHEGNALLNVGLAVAAAAAPALAGVVVSTAGVATALAIDAAGFLLMAAVLAGGSDLPQHTPTEGGSWARVREGLGYVRRHAPLGRLLAVNGFAIVCFTLVIPIEVVYARETLDVGSAGYAALLVAWGIGLLAGSLLFARARVRSPRGLITISTVAIAVAYGGMALTKSLSVACAWSLLGGVGNGVQAVAVITAIQRAGAGEYFTRVVALMESIASAAPGLGFLVGGVITSLTSPPTTYAVAAVGALVAVALFAGAVGRAPRPDPQRGSSR